MVTQRKHKQQTRRSESPFKASASGTRNNYRRSNSGGNLTSILVLCLCLAFGLLIYMIYLYSNKATPKIVAVEQKPIAPIIPLKVMPVEEQKPVVIEKKKPLRAVEIPKKAINLEITGDVKKSEDPLKIVEPEKKPVKVKNDDEPPIPKSFMGGLTNPEMEKNKDNSSQDQDRAREEKRKKKEVDIE